MQLATPTIDPSAFVAPGTHIYGAVSIDSEAVIMFGVVMRAELDRIEIGARSNIQDNSVIHVDEGVPCSVGSDVTVGHAVVLHGCTVANHCLIGIGARILNYASIGEGAWVGAGSLVPEGREIPPWTLAVGVPAKPIRRLTDNEIARQQDGIAHYLEFANAYRRVLDT